MAPPQLETVEVETGPKPTATVIFMHGLGADGHDFEPAVAQLAASVDGPLRFVLPHAPVRPVSFNAGMRMRAWYDIRGLDKHSAEDEDGFRSSNSAVSALIRRENERGIPAGRVVVGGFSQGGAMSLYLLARYPEKLAGIVALSCYLPLPDKFQAERVAANQSTPVFMAHGSVDEMIAERAGAEACATLQTSGYAVEWHSYPIGHAVCAQEISAINAFLRRVLAS
jgi:phospholipase/carboxylesterase